MCGVIRFCGISGMCVECVDYDVLFNFQLLTYLPLNIEKPVEVILPAFCFINNLHCITF